MNKRTLFIVVLLILIVGLVTVLILTSKQSENRVLLIDESSSAPATTSLEFIESETVSPDNNYGFGAFCRVNYVELIDEFIVTFGGVQPKEVQEEENRAGGLEGAGGYAYKFYNKDFEYQGDHGVYITSGGDTAVVMANGNLYHLTGGGGNGWKLYEYDASTLEELSVVEVDVDLERGELNDQMLSYINNHFVASSLYQADPDAEHGPTIGEHTHHTILNDDLEILEQFVLDDEPHSNGSSMVYVDGIYHFLTSTAFWGDLMVMMYDDDWNYLGNKILAENAQWPQGTVYDEENKQFYVAYIDLGGPLEEKSRTANIKLGVFDDNWGNIEIIDITTYETNDRVEVGRPSVFMKNNELYVSYDLSTQDEITNASNFDWQCIVDIYKLKKS